MKGFMSYEYNRIFGQTNRDYTTFVVAKEQDSDDEQLDKV